HPGSHPGPTATTRLLRWIEAIVLIVGVAMALMGCQSGAATGDTIGKGVGAWWSTISGDETDTVKGRAMGRALGHRVDTVLTRVSDRPLPPTASTSYSW